MNRASTAVASATVENPGGLSARFALVLHPSQDPVATQAAAQAALAALNAKVRPLSAVESRVLVADFPDRTFGADQAAAFAAGYVLADELNLAAAEPDLPTALFPEPTATPDDLAAESMKGLLPGCFVPPEPDLDARPRWALETLRVPQAWALSEALLRPSRGEGVLIAQPDTGITAHAELADVVTIGGIDLVDDDPDPTDPLDGFNPGHGTGTASVVVSPETLLMTGSAPRARHMPIRAIESVVLVTQVRVAEAIDHAAAGGAQVVTMSLGGLISLSVFRALRRAVEADVIVLAAAGNCVGTVVWPARFDDCIAVSATDSADRRWPGSSHGAAVAVSAPGQNVIKANLGPGGTAVGQAQGTSYAVALTAGVAALWLAHHGRPNLVAAARARGETLQVMFRRLVRATARRPDEWDPFEMGAGIVDAHALLAADLDLGRDRESADLPSDPRERAGVSVQSLVAETVGHEAARADVDWYRFGPELSATLLNGRVAPAPAAVRRNGGRRAEKPESPIPESPAPRRRKKKATTPVTAELAGAVTDRELRAGLGLPARRAKR